jgi:FtsH-binding integral membrane protein
VKEGKKTTEFYLSIFGAVLGVLVTTGLLTPEQSSALVESAAQISGAVISALSVFGYTVSRGLAKKDVK